MGQSDSGEGGSREAKEDKTLKSPEALGPRSFKDINKRQTLISRFMVALEKEEEKYKQRPPTPKLKPSTPVSTKVLRLEEGTRSPGISLPKSTRKILKCRDKPGSRIQTTMKKFLLAEDVAPKEGANDKGSDKPVRLGGSQQACLGKDT